MLRFIYRVLAVILAVCIIPLAFAFALFAAVAVAFALAGFGLFLVALSVWGAAGQAEVTAIAKTLVSNIRRDNVVHGEFGKGKTDE